MGPGRTPTVHWGRYDGRPWVAASAEHRVAHHNMVAKPSIVHITANNTPNNDPRRARPLRTYTLNANVVGVLTRVDGFSVDSPTEEAEFHPFTYGELAMKRTLSLWTTFVARLCGHSAPRTHRGTITYTSIQKELREARQGEAHQRSTGETLDHH